MENGYWDYKKMVVDAGKEGKLVGRVDGKAYDATASYDEESYRKWARIIDMEWLAQYLLVNDGDWLVKEEENSDQVACTACFKRSTSLEDMEYTICFNIGMDEAKRRVQENGKCDRLKFKANICAPINQANEDKVKMNISSGSHEEEIGVEVLSVVNKLGLTSNQASLKRGKQNQTAGEVIFDKMQEELFRPGTFTLKVKKGNKDCDIPIKKINIEGNDDLKRTISTINCDEKNIQFEIKEPFKPDTTMILSDLSFDVGRMVEEGAYDLEMSGTAINTENQCLRILDFIEVKGHSKNGLAEGKMQFTIGENGKIMIDMGRCEMEFNVGSRFAKIVDTNEEIDLLTAVVNRNSRIYVPACPLAELLNLDFKWDSSKQVLSLANME